MQDALNSKRSIQTIRDCTSIIATHSFNANLVQVRTLDNEAVPPEQLHFIVTFKHDVENARATVKPLAEAVFLNGRVRYIVKPAKQYPELERHMPMFSEVIETTIREFLSSHVRIVRTNIANDSANKWLLH
ncbi:hypothetical protein [Erwinia pyrifoliae]|uniref:Uncharacterized protein n=1 Tax=Erwinia pyrifoliae TaxID=79967 RepID=A0ABY5X8V2_ERWPY|nr:MULTISPECIES: hypothetical protein [Erwinia]AUX74200.1 hypothetical protein CPI84_18155 [Erwinia pyrifoliae]MCA8875449.1 hypothetical protein [Erwinia pyrifoliae]MCT2385259.1 hypothetical protein [Erwinia pyrifoliae]MCU8585517.1 hypothetical protein [Erwinia pyrifoliae]UWS33821.1 hypothetical protein NYP84_00900 [Erwinia pyrifoliae]